MGRDIRSVLLALLVCGCDGGEGVPDAWTPDAGPPDAGPPRTVEGTWVDTYVGGAEVPRDLSAYRFAAFMRDGDTYVEYPGTGHADGTYRIPDVPEGTYLHAILPPAGEGSPSFRETSWSVFNIHHYHPWRHDAAVAAADTSLVLDATGLESWQDGDRLELFASGTDLFEVLQESEGVSGLPSVGDTTLAGLAVSFGTPPRYLIDGGKGDEVILTQLATRSSTGATWQALSGVLFPGPVTMVDGTATPVAGGFVDTVPEKSMTLEWQAAAFAAHGPAINPGAFLTTSRLVIGAISDTALVCPNQCTLGARHPALVHHQQPAGQAVDLTTTYVYRDPFPDSDWQRAIVGEAWFQVDYLLPGAGVPVTEWAVVSAWVEDDPFTSQLPAVPLAPPIGPPLQPRIAGAGAFTAQQGVGLMPVLSWEPPAACSSHHCDYTITIDRLDTAIGGVPERVASFRQEADDLVLPAGVLQAGGQYVASIMVFTVVGGDGVAIIGTANLLTAPFTP